MSLRGREESETAFTSVSWTMSGRRRRHGWKSVWEAKPRFHWPSYHFPLLFSLFIRFYGSLYSLPCTPPCQPTLKAKITAWPGFFLISVLIHLRGTNRL